MIRVFKPETGTSKHHNPYAFENPNIETITTMDDGGYAEIPYRKDVPIEHPDSLESTLSRLKDREREEDMIEDIKFYEPFFRNIVGDFIPPEHFYNVLDEFIYYVNNVRTELIDLAQKEQENQCSTCIDRILSEGENNNE